MRQVWFFLGLMGCLTNVMVHAQEPCSPSLIGAPCAQEDLASQRVDSSPSLGLDNPVHLATGNKYHRVVDFQGAVFGLELVRHYNSLDRRHGLAGQAWRFSFETQLYETANTVQVIQADGQRIIFNKTKTACYPTSPAWGQFNIIQTPSHKRYLWQWLNGRSLEFNHRGQLERVTDRDGRFVRIDYVDHKSYGWRVERIVDSEGNHLQMKYDEVNNRLVVLTPKGNIIYSYDAKRRLKEVAYEDGRAYHYGYEQGVGVERQRLLTLIAVRRGGASPWVTVRTWRYDQHKRVYQIQKKEAVDRVHTLSINYKHQGTTYVDDSLRGEQVFSWQIMAGRYRLVTWRGKDCRTCVERTRRWSYDALGRLLSEGTLAKRYDVLGRPDFSVQGQQASPLSVQWWGNSSLPKEIRRNALFNVTQDRVVIDWLSFRDPRTQHWRAVPEYISWFMGDNLVKKIQIKWLVKQGIARSEQLVVIHDSVQRGHIDSAWLGFKLLSNTVSDRVWFSQSGGQTSQRFNAQGSLSEQRFDNGVVWTYKYDDQNHLIRLEANNQFNQQDVTHIDWQQGQVRAVSNESERQYYAYDKVHRLSSRTTVRGSNDGYTDRYYYDESNRLIKHHLPEGGAILYAWNQDGLDSITWQADSGRQVPLAGRFGHEIRLFNGLTTLPPSLKTAPQFKFSYKLADLINGVMRLGGVLVPMPKAWDQDGRLVSVDGSSVSYDQSGLAVDVNGSQLHYNSRRQLSKVTVPDESKRGEVNATYTYNGFGEKIKSTIHSDQHVGVRHYYYDQMRIVGESEQQGTIKRRYVYFGAIPIAVLEYGVAHPLQKRWWHTWRSWQPTHPQIYAVHTNAQYLPVALTDQRQNLRWQGGFTVLGELTTQVGDSEMPLRFPGQLYEPETQWHYNYQRTYVPSLGQYLEPDPLGPMEAPTAYAYAQRQPDRYLDPLGLLLFAFDGTRNTSAHRTNVYLMSQWYQDTNTGSGRTSFYYRGVGVNSLREAALASDAKEVLDAQWDRLLQALSQAGSRVNQIDLIGFSRGAALARHFANQIQSYTQDGVFKFQSNAYGLIEACVNLRFLGLFDTVTQFGALGRDNNSYNFQIAPDWAYVAHAVGLQEHRVLFPLTLIPNAPNRTQIGLIGSHSDIGGGYINYEGHRQSDDLSDVALSWMLGEAQKAGLKFGNVPVTHREVTDPVVHDERAWSDRVLPITSRPYYDEYSNRLNATRDPVKSLIVQPAEETKSMIDSAFYDRLGFSNRVGLVNMDEYTRWLSKKYGFYR